MKRIILALLVLTTARQAWAQHAQMETLVSPGKGGKTKIGAYGMPAAKFTSIDNKFGVLTGGYGGVLLNSKLMLGAGAYALVNNVEAPRLSTSDNNQYWNLWYTGFVAEYIHQSDKLIHWSAGALIGGGGVSKRDHYGRGWDHDDNYSYDYSGFFATEPFANLEINITTFLRLDIGASYRFVKGSSTAGITDGKLSGPAVHIGLKAGKF